MQPTQLPACLSVCVCCLARRWVYRWYLFSCLVLGNKRKSSNMSCRAWDENTVGFQISSVPRRRRKNQNMDFLWRNITWFDLLFCGRKTCWIFPKIGPKISSVAIDSHTFSFNMTPQINNYNSTFKKSMLSLIGHQKIIYCCMID